MKTFFKILKIIFIVLFSLILLAVVGGYIFLKTFDIKQYKTKIVAAAEKAIGRKVDFNDMELKVSIKEGIRFHVTDVTVSENPQFGTENFAKVKEVSVGVDVLSFINARQISVPSIDIKSPEVTIIRNAQGLLNVQTIGPAAGTSQQGASSPQSPSSAAAMPAIFINSLRIEEARLNYIDQSVDPVFQTAVSHLNVKVDHFSLTKPFNFAIEAAVLSPETNFKIDGNVDLNVLAKEARLSSVHVATDLGQFPLADLRRLPLLKGVPVPELLSGKYSATIKECVVSEKGLGTLILDSQLDYGAVLIKDVAPGISVDVSQINFSMNNFSFGKPFNFSLKAAYMSDVPNIDVQGNAAYDMTSQGVRVDNLVFNTDLTRWPLTKMKAEILPLKDVPLPQKLAGKLQVSVKELSAGPQGLGDFMLNVGLQEGEVSLKEIAPGISFDASKINFYLTDFSLKKPFKVALNMAYLSDAPNIDLQGGVGLDINTQSVRLDDFKLGVDLGLLSLERLKSSVSMVQGMPLPETLGGKFEATVKKLEAGPQGLKSVLADARFSDGKVTMANAAPGVSFKASQINLDVRDFTLDPVPFGLSLKLAYLSDVPNIQFNGSVLYDMKTQGVQLQESLLDVDLSHLNLTELKSSVAALATVPVPETLAGQLKVAIKDLSAGAKGLDSVHADVNLDNGAVSLKDITPGISVAASQIGLEFKNVSLGSGPIAFRVNAAYLSDKPNIDLSGTAALDLAKTSVQLKDTTFKTDLSLLSMDQLRSSVASLKDVPLPQTLKGLLNVQVDEATAGAKGLVSLLTHGDLTAATIKLKELTVPIDVSQLKFQADGTNAKLDDVLVSIGKGKIKTKATIDQYMIKPVINQEIIIEGLDLAEIVEQKEAPMKVQGLVNASIKIQGDPANVKSLTGDGTFDVKDAKVKGLNVIKTVFDSIKIPLLPNLSSLVMNVLPEEYKKQFEKPDTDFKSVNWTMTVSNGLVHLNPIDVQSDLFSFVGTGDVGFDQAYIIDGGFKLSEDLSALLVKDLENPFAYMVDETNLVSFPVHVKGKGSQPPVFVVDAMLKDLTKNALRSKGAELLNKVLNKGENPEGTTPPTGGQTGEPAEKTKEATPEQQLIDGIFGTIFK